MSFFRFFRSKKEDENPNHLIFKDDKGNQITLSDLEGVSGVFNWQIISNKSIPSLANQLHQEARQLGGQGKYELAIQKLMEAHSLAPDWPYPIYDLAYTYLLKKEDENALKYYELTDLKEPRGFFTAKTACWSLRKEKEGHFQ